MGEQMANSVNPSALTTKDTKVHEGNPHGDSRWKMEMYVVPGGDGRAVERGRLVVPAAQGGLDLFVDPVADRLHNFGFDDVALGVDWTSMTTSPCRSRGSSACATGGSGYTTG